MQCDIGNKQHIVACTGRKEKCEAAHKCMVRSALTGLLELGSFCELVTIIMYRTLHCKAAWYEKEILIS